MTENEALKLMESLQISKDCELIKTLDFKATVIKALEDLQQYRAIGTVEGYERAIEVSKENYLLYAEYKSKLQAFESIGTIEEFKVLKENERKCEECAGCTEWLCDCAHVREKAIDEFAERIKKEASECGWNCQNVYGGSCDYVSCEECESIFLKEIDEIAEQMKGGE